MPCYRRYKRRKHRKGKRLVITAGNAEKAAAQILKDQVKA